MEWVRERSAWISDVARGKAEPAAAARFLHLFRSTNESSSAQTQDDIEVLRKYDACCPGGDVGDLRDVLALVPRGAHGVVLALGYPRGHVLGRALAVLDP